MSGQSSANKANIQLAREQMAFQERMSGTAYQRAAHDLEKAGLNRILALGSPASSPAGQTAQVQNVKKAGVESALIGAQLGKILAETKAASARASLTKTQEDTIKPAAEIGDTIGGAIEDAKQNTDDLYNIARKKTTDLFELLDIGGHYKTNAVRHSAKETQRIQKELDTLNRQIDMDEKWLKIYKNEDVDTRQVEERLRKAKQKRRLIQSGK